MRRVRRLILAALLGGVLALAACGGDDDADNGGQRLSAAQYRAQLTQLCADSQREAKQIGGVKGANASALADYFDKIATVQTRRREQFDALRPPPEFQDEHTQIAPLLVEEIASIKQAATNFRTGSDPVSTYETFKTSENRVLLRQFKLLDKIKVPGCRDDVGSSAGAAPGPS